MKTNNSTETKKIVRFAYYSGNRALGCAPSEGVWDDYTNFTAADGSKWVVDLDDGDPHQESGYHYLLPATAVPLFEGH
jgi:hypothetical protein